MSLNFKFCSDKELDFYKRVLKYEESLVNQKQTLRVRKTYLESSLHHFVCLFKTVYHNL